MFKRRLNAFPQDLEKAKMSTLIILSQISSESSSHDNMTRKRNKTYGLERRNKAVPICRLYDYLENTKKFTKNKNTPGTSKFSTEAGCKINTHTQ